MRVSESACKAVTAAHRHGLLQEISKSNVVDDMVASNPLLYKPGEHPDHVVVIK